MTREKIIVYLELLLSDRDYMARHESSPGSIFAREAEALREAVKLLRADKGVEIDPVKTVKLDRILRRTDTEA